MNQTYWACHLLQDVPCAFELLAFRRSISYYWCYWTLKYRTSFSIRILWVGNMRKTKSSPTTFNGSTLLRCRLDSGILQAWWCLSLNGSQEFYNSPHHHETRWNQYLEAFLKSHGFYMFLVHIFHQCNFGEIRITQPLPRGYVFCHIVPQQSHAHLGDCLDPFDWILEISYQVLRRCGNLILPKCLRKVTAALLILSYKENIHQ